MAKTKTSKRTYPVLAQSWTESERGWGQRPDGYSLHQTKEDRDAFVDSYNKQFNNKAEVPDEYSFADGSPTVVVVHTSIYRKLKASKNGIWVDNLSNL